MSISEIKPHPKNYRDHPDDQIEHLMHNIVTHGYYRNIVVAADGTTLAGHGVVKALKRLNVEEVTVLRLPIEANSPEAIKVLVADNEISHLAMVDDRALTEALKAIKEVDVDGLLGTGFDEMMLAARVFVTRDAEEVEDFDAAAHWVGMPDYEDVDRPYILKLLFETDELRKEFIRMNELKVRNFEGRIATGWWPPREAEDVSSLVYDEVGGEHGEAI
jgi:hypothetical protein